MQHKAEWYSSYTTDNSFHKKRWYQEFTIYMQVIFLLIHPKITITKLISQIWITLSRSTIDPSGFNYGIVLLSTLNQTSLAFTQKRLNFLIKFQEMTMKLSYTIQYHRPHIEFNINGVGVDLCRVRLCTIDPCSLAFSCA